ncbi:hypothetical protein H0G86_002982 [Trichoderma simmonsii]|uniref:Uncharacterized protein n=1 Tax=Trichoderma simmonsii TaxID=1491479 RepID=A0A8G0L4L3_9HYPO|nr:hypothetical protein H0G86_002982 [Trichoderma simmonsii]
MREIYSTTIDSLVPGILVQIRAYSGGGSIDNASPSRHLLIDNACIAHLGHHCQNLLYTRALIHWVIILAQLSSNTTSIISLESSFTQFGHSSPTLRPLREIHIERE